MFDAFHLTPYLPSLVNSLDIHPADIQNNSFPNWSPPAKYSPCIGALQFDCLFVIRKCEKPELHKTIASPLSAFRFPVTRFPALSPPRDTYLETTCVSSNYTIRLL